MLNKIKTDVLIIGSGPAGCTAAIYTIRAGFKTLVLGGVSHGGQLIKTNDVENYPGVPGPISGFELMDKIHKQTVALGVEFAQEIVVKIEDSARPFIVHTASGKIYEASAIVVATGSTAKWLNLPSEEAFKGRGVSTCATCDGFFYKGKDVCVVGGGNKAFEEAIFLTRFCRKVYIVHRRDSFRAHKITIDHAKANPKIEFVLSATPKEIQGDETGVTTLIVEDTNTKELRKIPLQGIFVAIGTVPQTDFLKTTSVKLEPSGHVVYNAFAKTNVAGLFVAGDCTDKIYNQAITAAGMGAKAGMEVINFLNDTAV
ncbi:MAG: thioredoxin-disulfide reductase [Elusimicrobiota bacterium]|jgi:thioredoxin reductase (NADPH)|nr:thioredoxin-disulfide reductase [Elusimicrobiota bacterium]